jgi:hypothetical protein
MSGDAADIRCETKTYLQLVEYALKLCRYKLGLGLGNTFAHIDTRDYLVAWTYPSTTTMSSKKFKAFVNRMAAKYYPGRIVAMAAGGAAGVAAAGFGGVYVYKHRNKFMSQRKKGKKGEKTDDKSSKHDKKEEHEKDTKKDDTKSSKHDRTSTAGSEKAVSHHSSKSDSGHHRKSSTSSSHTSHTSRKPACTVSMVKSDVGSAKKSAASHHRSSSMNRDASLKLSRSKSFSGSRAGSSGSAGPHHKRTASRGSNGGIVVGTAIPPSRKQTTQAMNGRDRGRSKSPARTTSVQRSSSSEKMSRAKSF